MTERPKHQTRMDSALGPRVDEVRPATPNRPIRSAEHEMRAWAQGARFGGAQLALGTLGGARDIGVNLMILFPGKQNCPHHYHMLEEEHFYVLEGRMVLRSGDERHTMGPGDYVCFPAGTGVAHSFENPFAEPCRALAIGARAAHEVAVYADSGKMKLRAMGRIVALADPATDLDYWDGESIDEPVALIDEPDEPGEPGEPAPS